MWSHYSHQIAFQFVFDSSVTRALQTQAPGSDYFQKIANFTAVNEREEEFGTSVDISGDGTVVAISAIEESSASPDLFHYLVQVWKEGADGTWGKVGSDIKGSDNVEWREDARAHVSISGDGKRLAIANVHSPDRGAAGVVEEGVVEIFEHDLASTSTDWAKIATPYEDSAGGGGPKLGLKVSFDDAGSTLAIGERYYDDTGSDDVGRILVKTIATTSSGVAGVEAKGSNINGTSTGDHTGSSVMISGDGNCLIFGSTGDDGAGDSAPQMGSASIYCYDSVSKEWSQRGAVLHGDAAGDEFGSSVAINNDATYVAVGAIKYDVEGGTNAGLVQVYKWNETSSSYEKFGQKLSGEQGESNLSTKYYVGDYFGYSLDISDLTEDKIRVVIGAPNNGQEYYHGHARLYEVDTSSSEPNWTLVASDIDGHSNMSLGKSLAMSKTGKRIVLGGPTYNSGEDSYYEGLVELVEQTEISRMPSSVPSLSPSSSQSPSNIPSGK